MIYKTHVTVGFKRSRDIYLWKQTRVLPANPGYVPGLGHVSIIITREQQAKSMLVNNVRPIVVD